MDNYWMERLKTREDAEWKGDPRRYGKIPGFVLRQPDISDSSKLLYAAMDMVMGGEGQEQMEDGIADLMCHDMRKAAKFREEAKQ